MVFKKFFSMFCAILKIVTLLEQQLLIAYPTYQNKEYYAVAILALLTIAVFFLAEETWSLTIDFTG